MAVPYTQLVYLRSGLNPDLVLASYEGYAVIEWFDPKNKSQIWRVEDRYPIERRTQIINLDTGSHLAVAPNPQPLSPVFAGAGGGESDWEIAGNDEYRAIRLEKYPDLNLSVRDASRNLGAPTVVYGWSQGANEVWKVQPCNDEPPLEKFIVYFNDGSSGNGESPTVRNGALVIGPFNQDDPADLWEVTRWTQGYSFRNVGSGLFLGHGGADNPAALYGQMCIQALWTTAPPYYGRYYAWRPWENSDMNLTAEPNSNPQFWTRPWRLTRGQIWEAWVQPSKPGDPWPMAQFQSS